MNNKWSDPVQVEDDLRTILDYMWKDERRSYDECEPEHHANHIFTRLVRVKQWLNNGQKGGRE